MHDPVYLDNAATTKMDERVLEAILPYFREQYANPSAIYKSAANVKKAIALARKEAAAVLHADPSEIFFTSGGTEADNWALTGAFKEKQSQRRHIITTKIEHHALLHTCQALEREGAIVTYLDVDEEGRVSPDDVKNAIREDTILISVMTANNEIGTIQPIEEIGAIAHDHGILFHTDGVQAYGQIPLDVKAMHVDLFSASAHKIHGPKGIGLLYVRKGVPFPGLLHGGAQERGRRAGTENVPGIIGFGEAARLAAETLAERSPSVSALREEFIHELTRNIPGITVNGSRERRLPNNVNITMEGVDSEMALILLDQEGICASAGSACTSGSLDPSHVIRAIDPTGKKAYSTLRFTLSHETTREEIQYTVNALKTIVTNLRH